MTSCKPDDRDLYYELEGMVLYDTIPHSHCEHPLTLRGMSMLHREPGKLPVVPADAQAVDDDSDSDSDSYRI
jgi:hypothetical protein